MRGAPPPPRLKSSSTPALLCAVGSGNYYWAFPSKAIVAVRSRTEQLEAARAADVTAIEGLEARLAELSAGRDDAVSRHASITSLSFI